MACPHFPRLLILLTLFVLSGAGCEMETRVVRSSWDQLRQSDWYDPSASSSDGSSTSARSRRGYAIELARFSDVDAFSKVYRLIGQARQDAGLANLWYTATARETTVFAGRFASADSAEAKAMLSQVRAARIDGKTPFEDARVVSVTNGRDEVVDERDLRSLRGRGLYALQVGYFDGEFGLDFRKAAETAVDTLREQGEDAYYYHGPHRSMVLVNAWTYAEAFTSVAGTADRYSNAVRAVQEKHPYNVPNGRSFTAADDPAFVASQKSFLVPIR